MALLIELAPDGRLCARMDGHSVLLPPGFEVAFMRRILLAQHEHNGQRFATDSDPTQAQVDAWIKEHPVRNGAAQTMKDRFAKLTPDEQKMLLEMLEEEI